MIARKVWPVMQIKASIEMAFAVKKSAFSFGWIIKSLYCTRSLSSTFSPFVIAEISLFQKRSTLMALISSNNTSGAGFINPWRHERPERNERNVVKDGKRFCL